MTITRAWPNPTRQRRVPGDVNAGTVCLHLKGDTHAGPCPQWRYDAISREFRSGKLPVPLAHIQIGDNTDNGLAAENTKFANFIGRLPAPVHKIPGNHDLLNQTGAQWAAQWGYASINYTVDLPAAAPLFRLIALGCDNQANPDQMSAATIAYLDTRLGETLLPCFVAHHFPLYNSVAGDPTKEYTSTAAFFFARTTAFADSRDILAVLQNHANLKLWMSGHTHSRPTVPGILMPFSAGSVNFVSLNTSAVWYQGLDHNTEVGGPQDRCITCFLSWYPGNRFELRFRDHNAGQWLSPNGNSVMQVAIT